MDRHLGFVLVVMTKAMEYDRISNRSIAAAVVAEAVEGVVNVPATDPNDKDLYSYALEYVDWQYGTGDRPEWLQ